MASPLVTCVIPTHNRAQLALRAVESALAQTHQPMEVIVVDDSSDDQTRQLLQGKSLAIRYFKNDSPHGAPYSRNVGIHEAKGDVIAFLDDDDCWMPGKIAAQLELLRRYPIVSCNYLSGVGRRVRRHITPSPVSFQDLLTDNHLGSCSFVMLEARLARESPFDESLRMCQDWDMWLTIMARNRIGQAGCCQEFLVDYNDGPHVRITALDTDKRFKSYTALYEKHRQHYDSRTTRLFELKHIKWLGRSLPARTFYSLQVARLEGRSTPRWAWRAARQLAGIGPVQRP